MFANYFLLILIPVIVASVLAQVLVVRIIEKDAERFNQVVMNRFSEQTDAELQSLKTSMINILSTSRLRSVLLAPMSSSPESQLLPELLHSCGSSCSSWNRMNWSRKLIIILFIRI